MRAHDWLSSIALLVGAYASPACITPPALLSAGPADLAICLSRAPSGAQRVEIASDARCLRGVYVPASPDAPLVLHLLGSRMSVASLRIDWRPAFERLRSLDCASLVIDYGGVGASYGECSVEHLRGDALAMWRAALERVDGDPQRIVLRCTSLGGIAAAELIDAGARPRGVIWIAPVSPASAVRLGVARRAGSLTAALVSWAFAPLSRIDPLHAFEAARVPVWVLSSTEDSFLDREFHARLSAFAPASGGEFVECAKSEHEWLAVSNLGVRDHEAEWLTGPLRGVASVAVSDASAAQLSQPARERFTRLARLAPTLSREELAVAAEFEDYERARSFVWMRGLRSTPPVERSELALAYGQLAALESQALAELDALNAMLTGVEPKGLRTVADQLSAWDGRAPLETRWKRDDYTIVLEMSPTVEGGHGAARRAELLAQFARALGLVTIEESNPDGSPSVRYLADDGAWIELCGASETPQPSVKFMLDR